MSVNKGRATVAVYQVESSVKSRLPFVSICCYGRKNPDNSYTPDYLGKDGFLKIQN
jgi:hypothetical protein